MNAIAGSMSLRDNVGGVRVCEPRAATHGVGLRRESRLLNCAYVKFIIVTKSTHLSMWNVVLKAWTEV